MDVDEGASEVRSDGIAIDLDAAGASVLFATGARLEITDLEGRELRSTVASGVSNAVFLEGGDVCYTSGDHLMLWSPESGATTYMQLGEGLDASVLTAVGDRVVASTEFGPAVLIDPSTGAEIGERWMQGYTAAIAASPDGTRFAVGAHDESAIRPTLQIRDAASGDVVASVRGDDLSYISSIAWLTDDILLVMRTSTGTEIEPLTELRLADQLDTVTNIDPITPWMRLVAQEGALLLVGGFGQDVLLLRMEEMAR